MGTAYTVSITFTLLTLFGLGVHEGQVAGFRTPHSIFSGMMAAAMGLLVVVFETMFE